MKTTRAKPAADWSGGLLDGYEPTRWWEDDPATDAQIECLRRRGYEPPDDCTKGQACFLIERPTPR
jgi:hypothetical protein